MEENTKFCLQEMEWERIIWIDLAQDRVKCPANAEVLMNLRVP